MRASIDTISARLQAAGMRISAGDRFVIGAAQTLIARAADDLSFDEIKLGLDTIRLTMKPKAEECEEAPETDDSELTTA